MNCDSTWPGICCSESDALIRDISAASGFSDQANFSRLFRRISGISPRQFRQEIGDGAK